MTDLRISQLTRGTPNTTDVTVYTNGTTTYKAAFNTIGSALQQTFQANYIISNGTTAITQTGMYPYFGFSYAGSITAFEMYSGTVAGNATIGIWKGNSTTPPTTSAQLIAAATMTGGTKYIGTPANWGTNTFSANDIFAINLSGVGTIPWLSLMIRGNKNSA